MSNSKRGFTLIELLVVLAIIALLTSVIFVSVVHMQEKSRDTRRMEDISSLTKALAIYQTSSSHYPISVATTTIDGTDSVSLSLISADAIPAISKDPLHPTYSYRYITNDIGTDYVIYFCLEGSSVPGYTAGCTNQITP